MSYKKSHSIAIVGNTAWGIYNFRLPLLQKLQSLGHHVVVIAPNDEFGDQYSKKLTNAGFEFIHLPIDSFGKNVWNDVTTFWALYGIYQQFQFDFVFHYTIKPNIYGTIAACLLNIPSIAVVTGLGRLRGLRPASFWKKAIFNWYQFGLSYAHEVWFLNDEDKATFDNSYFLQNSTTQLLASEGIDTHHFKPKNHQKNKKNFTFLFAGRLLWDKGIRELAEAAKIIKKKYPNIAFILAGYIHEKDPNHVSKATIEAWEAEHLFQYMGAMTDIRIAIDYADVVILPSQNYGEGVPRILLEAAAMEKPILASNIAGCKEVVIDGMNGFLFDITDVTNLVETIEKILNTSEQQRKEMGRKGRRLVQEKFESTLVVKQYINTLQKYLPAIEEHGTPNTIKRVSLSEINPILQTQ
jgi:glycosyltransferase involved in cell wall biosynthesis